ncbi:hypothetical protein DFH07DRAFT_809318 [Mycena maculata]|uniref:F-box domain-containing protein n=1 Tax=Mycena maculata TaxID=230809 RepID=A0AAD7NMK9_9AGAR|nr:hypothetical protein DFH07DRAFT_809318 [Mycena maculata]
MWDLSSWLTWICAIIGDPEDRQRAAAPGPPLSPNDTYTRGSNSLDWFPHALMDTRQLDAAILSLREEARECRDHYPVDYHKCNQILAKAEALKIDVDLAYPWPSLLPELFRLLRQYYILFMEASERAQFWARLCQLETRWDRLRVMAVGRWWSRKFPNGIRIIPTHIPPEILHKILSSHVADTHESPEKNWHEGTDFILSCCLVSKDWNSIATDLLYRPCIELGNTESISKLLRTISNDDPFPRAVHHLVLTAQYTDKTFPEVATKLLAHCPSLRTFQIAAELEFSHQFEGSFLHLSAVMLRGVFLREFARLLTNLPNLTILHAEELQIFSGRLHAYRSGTDPPGDTLTGIPLPTYHLKCLHLETISLTEGQIQWLLPGSMPLEALSLRGVYAPALARLVGPRVTHLRLTPEDPDAGPGEQSDHLASMLPMFTSLDTLCLVGERWPWASVLGNVSAPITELTMSWSPAGFAALAAAMEDRSWQRQLREISVFFRYSADAAKRDFVEVYPASQKLKEFSHSRNITLHWFSDRPPTVFTTPFVPFYDI